MACHYLSPKLSYVHLLSLGLSNLNQMTPSRPLSSNNHLSVQLNHNCPHLGLATLFLWVPPGSLPIKMPLPSPTSSGGLPSLFGSGCSTWNLLSLTVSPFTFLLWVLHESLCYIPDVISQCYPWRLPHLWWAGQPNVLSPLHLSRPISPPAAPTLGSPPGKCLRWRCSWLNAVLAVRGSLVLAVKFLAARAFCSPSSSAPSPK